MRLMKMKVESKRKMIAVYMKISIHEASNFILHGAKQMNKTYTLKDERINIISKNKTVKDISQEITR
jgi:hypothetical protein